MTLMRDVEGGGSPPQRFYDPAEVAAFEKFYREEVPGLVAFLRYLGASYSVAADIVQETMIKALPPKLEELTNPHAWCRTVCWNAYQRYQSRECEVAVPELYGYGDPLITPDSRLEEIDQYHRVIAALHQLPPRRRAVMAFRYDGATHAEIAMALDMDPATVRSTYRAAKVQLEGILRDPDWGMD